MKTLHIHAGFIAGSKRATIYIAKMQGIDDTDGKYAVVCNKHNSIVNVKSLKKARSSMKAVDFCEGCR